MDKDIFPLQYVEFRENRIQFVPNICTPYEIFLLDAYIVDISHISIKLRYRLLKD